MLTGCEMLGGLLGALGLKILGVNPAADYRQTGKIGFSLLSLDEEQNPLSTAVMTQSLQAAGLGIQIQNGDGTLSSCEFVDERGVEGSPYNSIMILIDDSGSMVENDPQKMRAEAAIGLAETVQQYGPKSHMALGDFGRGPSAGNEAMGLMADFSNDKEAIRAATAQIEDDGDTPLWDALGDAIRATRTDANKFEQESTSVQRFIVVLSDGEDTGSYKQNLESIITWANKSQTIIHTIGLGPASVESELNNISKEAIYDLQKLAAETGGYYASVSTPESLKALYKSIATSMIEGYSVNTFKCQPRKDEQSREPSTLTQGQTIQGIVSLGQSVQLPWKSIAP